MVQFVDLSGLLIEASFEKFMQLLVIELNVQSRLALHQLDNLAVKRYHRFQSLGLVVFLVHCQLILAILSDNSHAV